MKHNIHTAHIERSVLMSNDMTSWSKEASQRHLVIENPMGSLVPSTKPYCCEWRGGVEMWCADVEGWNTCVH